VLHFLQNIHFPLKGLLENGLQEDLLLVNDLGRILFPGVFINGHLDH